MGLLAKIFSSFGSDDDESGLLPESPTWDRDEGTIQRGDEVGWPAEISKSLAGVELKPFCFDIVGESYYQENLASIAGPWMVEGKKVVEPALLVLEDDNPHDDKAVRVDVMGMTVGHLARRDARRFRRAVKRGERTVGCNALIHGGWQLDEEDEDGRDFAHYGVMLDIKL